MIMGRNNGLEPTALVIFGITGDLARKKLLPALAELENINLLPEKFEIIGLSRRDVSVSEILTAQCDCLKKYIRMVQMDMNDPNQYHVLKRHMEPGFQTIFYLAVPPAAVLPVVSCLGGAKLNGPSAKLLLEKPFGTDLPSAKGLINRIKKYFDERQVYRIDHYLAKEAAQNIAVFLGSNAVFREVWSKDYIEKIEIFAAEKIGVEGRFEFWEETGVLRDMVQSHILQLAALVLMEPCDDFTDVEHLPRLRLAALKKMKANPDKVLRGQYKGYSREAGNPQSTAETFAALELKSTDTRWKGIPIVLATGKCLSAKDTKIRVYFRKVSASMPNLLTINIQPKEGIVFDLWVKEPGPVRKLKKLPLSFSYSEYYQRLPEAYEQVLLDAIRSNHSLFASGQEVLASWQILQPVLDKWSAPTKDLFIYEPGLAIESLVQKMYN